MSGKKDELRRLQKKDIPKAGNISSDKIRRMKQALQEIQNRTTMLVGHGGARKCRRSTRRRSPRRN